MIESPPPHFRVAIAGSGFGGLGSAIRLLQGGIDDFVVLERASDLGGVWRDNSYPGCACDVESHLYSFSFARNPSWTRTFSASREIHAYLRQCAERFNVTPHLRYEIEIREAAWNEDAQHWHLETSRGALTADVFIAAVGGLSEPAIPSLPGLETFAGKTFHSARWDHDYDLTGKHVAVIGTGASAIQFIPRIQPRVGKLHVFQRTPPWIVPRRDRALGRLQRRLLHASNTLQWLKRAGIYGRRELTAVAFFEPRIASVVERLARRHLHRSVRDPELRAKLTPRYTLGCKRILLSDDYLPAITKPNVELVTEPLREIVPAGVVTGDGAFCRVDAIIFGTGFRVQDFPFAKHVRGREGVTLAETWKETMTAHLGTTVAGYPNLFILQGPNTALGHTSVITMLESQIEHILKALRFMGAHGIGAMEPRPDVQAAFVSEVDRKMKGTVWTAGGCKSWYLDAHGRNSTLWPGFTFSFKRRVEPFEPRDYRLVAKGSRS